MRGLPATHEIKLSGETIEDVALAAQNAHAISFPTVSDGNVEVAAKHQVGPAAKLGDAVKNMLHSLDVTAVANGSMNAKHFE